jgi:hypothetical protein
MRNVKARRILLMLGFMVMGRAQCAKPQTDEYYPAEEARERQSIIWPRLVRLQGSGAVLAWPGESPHTLRVGDRYREWELMAVFAPGTPMAVLERDFTRWGVLAYVGERGLVATVRKAVGKLDNLPRAKTFPPEYFDRVLSAREDLLGQQALATGLDTESVAALLPPLRAYTFLGTTTSRRKVIVWPDGRLGFGVRHHNLEQVLFDPGAVLGESKFAGTKQGLMGGYLPAVDYAFSGGAGESAWEEIAFAVGRGEDATTFVGLRTAEGKQTYWQLPELHPLENGNAFYLALLSLEREWDSFLSSGMQLATPDARVNDAGRAALVRALITEVGLHPKYGVGAYSGGQHDTFPPATILLNRCLLDWGFNEEVKARLGDYLSHFVKPDGTFDYYGPALSEYGQMLSLAARYVRQTHDIAWLEEYDPALMRIADLLRKKIDAGHDCYPPATAYCGLLQGPAEADTRAEQKYYFSSAMWTWRGLEDLGELLNDLGARQGNTTRALEGKSLIGKAAAFRRMVLVALDHARLQSATPPFLGPIAGMDQAFGSMTESRFASYTNYRYWPEMLSAGMLQRELVDDIINYRASHGGEVAATTRFGDGLDDWPYSHFAWGLMETDQREHFLLGFYGHMAFHQTPGSFTAYESVPIRGDSTRNYSGDYCVPAQLVAPQMLRWMVAWQPWDEPDLWLARAVPDAWWKSGFSARHVPTRWGDLNLVVSPVGKGLSAQVDLWQPHPDLAIHLRLPPALAGVAPQVTVHGTKNWEWEASQQSVRFWGAWNHVTVIVSK